MDRKSLGVDAAVEALRQEDVDVFLLDRAEQLDLIPDGAAAVDGAAEREALREANRQRPAGGPGKPPGRRKGIPNKRTVQLRDAIYQQCGNPILALAREFGFVPIEVLAKRLKCSMLEAGKMKATVLMKVAEYTDQKQPQGVQVSNGEYGPAPVLHMTADGAAMFGLTPEQIVALDPEGIVIDGEAEAVEA